VSLVPDVSAPIYSSSAFILGLLLCDDLTPAEQNSLGSWFMLLGQTLCTNSAQQQLLNNRKKTFQNDFGSRIVNDDNLRQSAENIKKEVNNIWNNY